MANYADARWKAFQYKLNDMMQMPEYKSKPSPAFMKFLQSTDFLIPASEKERVLGTKQSDQDTVEINLIDKQSITPSNARSYSHPGNKNDSTQEDVTFTTYAANFTYSLKEADRTIWSQAEIVSKQLRSAIIALHDDIETDLLAQMNTDKSQVVQSATPRSGAWDGANYIFGIANGDYDLFLHRLKGFMREQYHRGVTMESILDETLFQKAMYLANQGAGNNANYAFQFGGVRFGEDATQELTLDTGYVGMGYIYPMGGIGILPWIPKLNRQGFGDPGREGGLYTTIQDPLGTGLTFAVHEYYGGADNDGTSGETQDIDVNVEISIDLGPVVAPMSTANASPIYKFGVLQ